MSVIVENHHGEIVLYCKGADSVIQERMCPESKYVHVVKVIIVLVITSMRLRNM